MRRRFTPFLAHGPSHHELVVRCAPALLPPALADGEAEGGLLLASEGALLFFIFNIVYMC